MGRQKSKEGFTLVMADGKWCYWCHDSQGRRVRRSTGKTSVKEAYAVILEREAAGTLADRANKRKAKRRPDGVVPSPGMTLAEWSRAFYGDGCPIRKDRLARGGHMTLGHTRAREGQMRNHVLPFLGGLRLDEISRRDVNDWLLELPARNKISWATANKALSALRAVLDVAVFEELIPANPAASVKPLQGEENGRDAFTPREADMLLAYEWDSPLMEAAVKLAVMTGMRLGEIRGLRVWDVGGDFIDVRHSYTDTDGLKTTKGRKVRRVPLPAWFCAWLRRTGSLSPEGWCFSVDGKRPVCKRFVDDRMRKAVKELGIPGNKTFHSFRHFVNTLLITSGASPDMVRLVVGHQSEAMTRRYLHTTDSAVEQVREVVEGSGLAEKARNGLKD